MDDDEMCRFVIIVSDDLHTLWKSLDQPALVLRNLKMPFYSIVAGVAGAFASVFESWRLVRTRLR